MPFPLVSSQLSGPGFGTRPSFRKLAAKAFLAGAFVLLICPASLAQDPNPEDVVRVRTDLVTIPVTVVNSSGRRVSGLTQEDFTMLSDGQEVKIGHFSSGTDRVALLFLLDASGSARDYLSRQRDAALALFARLGNGSQVAVAHFGNRLKLTTPFTDEINTARGGFDFAATTGQHSAIFDSAATAVQLLAQRPADPTERRIIILTSDGLDTASATRAAAVVDCARQNTISFYIIHFPLFAPHDGHLVMRPTAKGFRDLAEKTGGRLFTAGDVKLALNPGARYDLAAVFKSIEEDLASQYVVGYYPTAAMRGTGDHKIEVVLAKAKKNNLRVEPLRRSSGKVCLAETKAGAGL